MLLPMAVTVSAVAAETPPEPTRTIDSPGNPIIMDGSLYTADAASMVGADGRFYIHAGHDEASTTTGTFRMNDYVVMATDDPTSGKWDIYEENFQPGNVFSWATGNAAYAGQALQGTDGRYYWYAPVEWNDNRPANKMAIGVAVSDSPVGPWEDALGKPLVTWLDIFGNSTNGQEVIDPHTFIDDDGRVYLYWGSWYYARGVELETDMITLKGEVQRWGTNPLNGFFEAPWVFKRNNIYYMAYDWKSAGSACTPSNYQACIAYATSPNPLGPWTYKGIILGGSSATTVHPSITEFEDQWYITYHTKDAVDGGHFRRSVAIDKLEWDGDNIAEVKKTRADDPAYRLTNNVALAATPTASFTETPPMRIGALNDGRASGAMLPPDQWGNYRGTSNTVRSDWIMYTWDEAVTVNGLGIMFHQDSNWIRPPDSWRVEYLGLDGDWRPLELSGTPTAVNSWHNVTFDTVQATAMRMTLDGRQNANGRYHSVSVSEWEVYGAPGGVVSVPEVTTKVGTAPKLPAAVRIAYPDGATAWAPVNWLEVDPASYAAEGEFVATGRALGYTDEMIKATVKVTADGLVPPGDDDEAPVASIELLGTSGGDEWYSSNVTPRVRAMDNLDYELEISGRVDDGQWRTESGVRYVDLAAVSRDGEHKVEGRAKDSSDNESEVVSKTFKIDKTAPVVQAQLDEAARAVTVTATDALSGIAKYEYRLDDGAWTEGVLGEAVLATASTPQAFGYRVSDVAGNIAQGTVTIPRDENAPLSGNIAPFATTRVSSFVSWEGGASVGYGLNDGKLDLFSVVGDRGMSWGTWPNLGEQWAELTWDFEVNVDAVGAWWYHDGTDNSTAGMKPPREWKVQYYADGKWADVTPLDGQGYSRARDVFNTVEFETVTTTRLRIVAEAYGDAEAGSANAQTGSVGMREFHVRAAEVVTPEPTDAVKVTTASRCVAGKTVLTVSVENVTDSVVEAKVVTPYGEKAFVLQPGKTGAQAFSTRAVAIDGGEVTVFAAVEGEEDVAIEQTAVFEASSCG